MTPLLADKYFLPLCTTFLFSKAGVEPQTSASHDLIPVEEVLPDQTKTQDRINYTRK